MGEQEGRTRAARTTTTPAHLSPAAVGVVRSGRAFTASACRLRVPLARAASAYRWRAPLALTTWGAARSAQLNGVVVKYSEPEDAAKPSVKWRLYVFKGKEALEPYHIHRQSAYLLGRERRVCDIPLDHPSCSSQHAALQFRMTVKPAADDETRTTRQVRPYLIDVGSTNGSYVNNERIEPQRFVELLEKDVLRFGYSSREYVLLVRPGAARLV